MARIDNLFGIRYQRPDIYSEEIPGPQLSVFSSVPIAVALFGMSRGFQTFRESLKINPDTTEVSTQIIFTIIGSPTSFTLTIGGKTTSSLAGASTAAQVQTAIRALTGTSDDAAIANTTVTGANGGPYTVNIPLGDFSGSSGTTTGGSGASVSPVTTHTGVPAINKPLTKTGVKLDSIKVVDPSSGTPYYVDTDWVAYRTAGGGTSETTQDDQYTLRRVVDGGYISPGQIVQVSYSYTDTEYFKVQEMFDPDDVRDFYGEPFDEVGNVVSELTLAAQIAFQNGASSLLTCAVEPEDADDGPVTQDYIDALNKFVDWDQVSIVVPAYGDPAILPYLKSHVTTQSDSKYERTAIFGNDGVSNPLSSPQRRQLATGVNGKLNRLVIVSPDRWRYYIPELNQNTILGSQFVAAAVAGLASSLIPAMPLTAKAIAGFLGPAESQKEGEKLLEAGLGLMVVEATRRGQIAIMHGVTTDPTDIHTFEYNIVRQADVMLFRIRDYLFAEGLIGQPILEETLIQVKASTKGALENLVDNKVIRGYQNLKVRQLGNKPDVVETRFEWKPAYPLNYIVIRYSVAVQSGDITVSDQGL